MLLTDAEGTPLGVDVESASPHEVKLIERLLEKCRDKRRKRCRLLYDRAADSEPLRTRLKQRGVRLIAPYRRFKNRPAKKLSRWATKHYGIRWKVERTFAWLKYLRRLGMRWEYHAFLFEGFWQLGCVFTILKGL